MNELILACLICVAQVRDPGRAADLAGGRIAGRVVGADTNRPVSRAAVRLVRVGERADLQVTSTDDEGRFVIDIAPGVYSVLASKPGTYAETGFGQSTPETPSRPVTVVAGETIQVEIAMFRGATISGRVFDHTGEPLALAGVSLSDTSTLPGSIDMSLRTVSNDRGEYRLFGLRAGEYILMALAPRLRSDTRLFAPIYYPGVTDIAAAARIQLSPGQELAGADVTLKLVSPVTVSGLATGPDGQPMPGGSIAAYLAGPDGKLLPRALQTRAMAGFDGLSGVGSIKADGTFSIDLIPGQYILRGRYDSRTLPAEAVRYPRALMVSQPVTIGETDISNMMLRFAYGATITGRFVFEGQPPPRVDVFRVAVESGEPGAVVSASPAKDGTFALGGIESGSRRVKAVSPEDWVLKGILVNGRDVADVPIELGEENVIGDVSVVFTSSKTPMTVTIDGARPNSTVAIVAFPEDSTLWHAGSRRITARLAGGTPTVLTNLPAGDYLVAAVADVSPDALTAGELKLLERLRAGARKAELVEGKALEVHVAVQVLK